MTESTRSPGRTELGGVRILVFGSLTCDVLVEMEGFGVRAEGAGLLLVGGLPDQAALSGLLHRLRRAGLAIRSVERRADIFPAPQPEVASGAPRLVRIELEGGTPHLGGRLRDAVIVHEGPRPVLELTVTDDDDLFTVLDDLEDLGAVVWSVDARG